MAWRCCEIHCSIRVLLSPRRNAMHSACEACSLHTCCRKSNKWPVSLPTCDAYPDDLDKYVALNALHDRNEALFFRVVCENIDEIQPLIYTPTVGRACKKFGDIFQR